MPVSNYVIRRYTPPTCTLEVLAQNSPLSKWMGKSVLKQLRFELRFDDPRLPEERRIAIRGNHDQLEALCAAVTNYVQDFLHMSPENFWATFSDPEDATQAADGSEENNIHNSSIQTSTVTPFQQAELPAANISSSEIHIKPSSHLTHNLFLGSLANQVSGNAIQLSLLQLFDLATALDEYSVDVVSLPSLQTRSVAPALSTWAPVAAVLLLGVGLTPLTWQYATRFRQQQTAKQPTVAPEKVALEPSPSLNQATSLPKLVPPDKLPSLPTSPLAPNLPLPVSTLPPTAQQTSPLLSSAPQKSTTPNIAVPSPLASPGSSLTVPGMLPVKTLPIPSSQNTLPPTLPNTGVITVPSNPTQKDTALNLKSGVATSSSRSPVLGSTSAGSPAVSPPLATLPRTLPTPITSNPRSQTGSVVPPSLATLPTPVTGNLSTQTGSVTDPSVVEQQEALITKLRTGRQTKTSPIARNSAPTRTLFDTTQIAEAREFLKKRWQPPSSLKRSLEYSLIVGVDGTIERIFPLGKAARDYIDRSGMPLIGEPFISPNQSGQVIRMRAVLSPNGRVQTFPEKD